MQTGLLWPHVRLVCRRVSMSDKFIRLGFRYLVCSLVVGLVGCGMAHEHATPIDMQSPTADSPSGNLAFRVVDATNRPVTDMRLTVMTPPSNEPHLIVTDADGYALMTVLRSTFIYITDAVQGTEPMTLQPNTLDIEAGIRIGVLPTERRSILLIVAEDRLFLAPEVVFAGDDPKEKE